MDRILGALVFAVFVAVPLMASATIDLSFDDLEATIGQIETSVNVSGGETVTSISVAFGVTQISGDPASEILIRGFDPTGDLNTIWTPNVGFSVAPPIPAEATKFNIAQAEHTTANGSVVQVLLDASNTKPGDVFEVDLDFLGFSAAALGSQPVDETLTFDGGLITIVPLLGDYNVNGQWDVEDINALTNAVKGGENPVEFDLTGDGLVDANDRLAWVEDVRQTFFGDANLDGEFSSEDFITVFRVGQYEDGVPNNSTWETGDWNGDCEFDTSDFIAAFQAGAYERGPRVTASIPEPSCFQLVLLGSMTALLLTRTNVK